VKEDTVVASTMDLVGWLRKHLEAADTDLLREMVLGFVQALMGAEADALCGAGHGKRSPERVNQRNGYRPRRLDTRVGTLDLEIPSSGRAATSRAGCWNHAGGPNGPGGGGGRVRCAWGVDPPGRGAGGDAGDHLAVQVAGLRARQDPRW
jgi:hypothetical protein